MNKNALEIYEYLQKRASWPILDKLGIDREPHANVIRTRPWGLMKPQGIAFHYTGGANGLKTMNWFNSPLWHNKSSSCQILIFDRIPHNIIGEMWDKLDKEILELFPVPTMILADWRWSTWCTNWANSMCMGIENRNIGYNLKPIVDKPYLTQNNKIWEKYSREQLICNVNIGRVIREYSDGLLDRNFCVGHHMIHSRKQDPGPAFPLKGISDAVFTNENVNDLDFIKKAVPAPCNSELRDFTRSTEDKRDNISVYNEMIVATDNSVCKYYICNMLFRLGFNCLPEVPDAEVLNMFIIWFQKSTLFYRKRMNRLVVDGDFGPKTRNAMEKRLKDLGL